VPSKCHFHPEFIHFRQQHSEDEASSFLREEVVSFSRVDV